MEIFIIVNSNEVHSIHAPKENMTVVLQMPLNMFEKYYTGDQFICFAHAPQALEQYHLVLKKCPAQRQQMRDVLVYPDKGRLRPEEQAFVDLLHKEAASTVK